jgi:peroxiredoxin
VTVPSTTPSHPVVPRQPAPPLDVALLEGDGGFSLSDNQPPVFTLVLFYRGLHCPVCRAQLTELDARLDEFAQRGVDVIAISADTADRASRARSEWQLERLRLGIGLDEVTMRRWGLFVSRAIKESEPDFFNEPGLFLVGADGTVFYGALNSGPWARPRLDDVLACIDFVRENDYPARGES